jgi:CRISPR type III-B/RAMP module RAMP protein Cmr6
MRQGRLVPPADYLPPNPVYFLTVRSGTQFRFRLMAYNADIIEQAVSSMHEAIELLGVGAKTRAGYGGLSLIKS